MDEFVISLAELAEKPRPRALVGGKAFQLARLVASGLPVPRGFVLTTATEARSGAELCNIFNYLYECLAAISETGPFAVRSSAVIEDGVASSAPGIFASILGVELAEIEPAVRRVWASSRTGLVRDYAAARGLSDLAMAVLVQVQVPAVARTSERGEGPAGTLYTRPPGRPDADEMVVETHFRVGKPGTSIRLARSGPLDGSRELALDSAVTAELRDVALRAERAIEAAVGADIEWVIGDARIWLVQARPVVHPSAEPGPPFPPALLQFSRVEPELVWRMDVSHNPDPLSPAQSGLVERMDGARLAPYRMRVVGGYLYSAALEQASPPELAAEDLQARFDTEIAPAMEAALATAEGDVTSALDAYGKFYAIYAGVLSPLLAETKKALPRFLDEHFAEDGVRLAAELLGERSPASLQSLLLEVARGERSFAELLAEAGAMSPAWDVAATTYAETPAALRRAVELAANTRVEWTDGSQLAATLRGRLSAADAARFDRCLAAARVARDIGEQDDRWYARAQAGVRQAMLALAAEWRLADPEDIFYLPLEMVLRVGRQTPDPKRIRRLAQAGRAARRRQRNWRMPLVFADGEVRAGTRSLRGAHTWQGRGIGGRAQGSAIRIDDLNERPAIENDSIVVARILTPAMVFALHGASALVSEFGGLLGHGAAMARELGIPCVVACANAWHEIHTGDSLWIDGDAGLVIRRTG